MKRYDIYVAALDPAQGSDMQMTRPCVIISPSSMNDRLRTVIIAPLTQTLRAFPFRVPVTFTGKPGSITLDHIRSVDKSRLIRRVGSVNRATAKRISSTLVKMFADGG